MTDYLEIALRLVGKHRSWKGWIKTFYPEPARKIAQELTITALELISHSYLKWLGLQPEILSKCGLYMHGNDLMINSTELELMEISAVSCSLCWAYNRNSGVGTDCTICPLLKERGSKCDQRTSEYPFAPWITWAHTTNPREMLVALEKAREYVKNNPDLYQGVQYQRENDGR